MRAIALALIIGLGGIQDAMRGKSITDYSPDTQGLYGLLIGTFFLCLIFGK